MKEEILTMPVVAVAQGPVSVVVVVVVVYEYYLDIRCLLRIGQSWKVKVQIWRKTVLTTVLVPELMVEVVVDCFTDRQEHPLLMREGVGYALM